MRIVVNAKSLVNKNNGCGYYTYELFERLTKLHAEHSFLFISDTPLPVMNLPANVETTVIGSPSKTRVGQTWWLNVQAKAVMRRWKADVFVNLDGAVMKTDLPQVTGITDEKTISRERRSLAKAYAVIATSEFLAEKILTSFPSMKDKVSVINLAAREIYKPLNDGQEELIKQAYIDGKDYFLVVDEFEPGSNLLNIMKAFSQFKHWQQSSMKLVILSETKPTKEMEEKLATYKFKDDVVVMSALKENERTKLVAAAYALIYAPLQEGNVLPVLEAMQSGTPVICPELATLAEVCGETALYADVNNPKDIATEMIQLYKDEELKSRLASEGKIRVEKFNWNASAEKLWAVIENVVSKAELHSER